MCEGDFTPIPADRNEGHDVMFVEVVAAPSAPMLPVGQIAESHVQPCVKKYFDSLLSQNHFYIHRCPGPHRGAFRDRHGRWVRDAMDAACQKTNDIARGRRSRVVLTLRRWRQVLEKQASCKFLASFLGATVANKPGHRGEREISR
jgi:hypothetical protein